MPAVVNHGFGEVTDVRMQGEEKPQVPVASERQIKWEHAVARVTAPSNHARRGKYGIEFKQSSEQPPTLENLILIAVSRVP
jgi:hypothetical protein